MPLDTCITNVGEYYSSHYLETTFANDLKDLGARWRDRGAEAPPRRLQRLSQSYFRAKALALEESNPENRIHGDDELAGWHTALLEALGYADREATDIPVEGGHSFAPAVTRVNRYNRPWLVICETVFCLPEGSLKSGQPSEDPLSMLPLPEQLTDSAEHALCEGEWGQVIGRIFTDEDAPRWILFLAGSQVLLLDKNTYSQGRYLAFDLDDSFGRKEKGTFDHLAAFLACETLCPGGESDEVLHDRLEEQSHRFAHGVTDKLQFSVRESIELLVNEWVEDRRRKQLSYTRRRPDETGPDGKQEITPDELTREALAYVYRLLFCFYAEARGGEMELLPIDDDTYRLGYSLEAVRDLEQVPLTPTTEEGTYFQQHLQKLFGLIHHGFRPEVAGYESQFTFQETVRTFTVRPLTATLFSPAATPLLDRARLSNRCLQQIIRRLSLSIDDRTRTVGRVNYAELGINQLGAVYEGLLSYKGMFADQDLIHVKSASGTFFSQAKKQGGKWSEAKKTPTWFVSVDRLEEFEFEEVERIESGAHRIYRKGEFVMHLSGIDREQSASYYTPEVLTRCLVEEALRELLKDYTPADADRILDLKICEPAMGSGAFLNEATSQLAHRYLDLKQKQLQQAASASAESVPLSPFTLPNSLFIDPAYYGDEHRRVMHYIATRNVYGVDLNATAVELGALSLWLGSIHRLLAHKGENGGRDIFQSGATPWFGLRLRCGNSLIGARRAVWTTEQLKQGKHVGKESAVPRLLKPGEARAANEIYHFLVFDEEMIPTASDKLMRQFWPERCGKAKDWLAKQVKPKWKADELKDAVAVCELIDHHWQQYATERARALDETACTATVWPTPSDDLRATHHGPALAFQEEVRGTLEATSGSFQRLKLVMDTWCAFWFWPLEGITDLPTREGFLASARLLLGSKAPKTTDRAMISARVGFEIDALLSATPDGQVPDTTLLAEAVPWFGRGHDLATEQVFHHWELVFPEMLAADVQREGFDLILGNPPWIKSTWADAAILCEFDPILGVKDLRSADFNEKRTNLLKSEHARASYEARFRLSEGNVRFLNSCRVYDVLVGIQTNLYKNFIVRVWSLVGERGIIGLLHPEGPYDDANGNKFRTVLYPRLRGHFQFKNELQMFPDVAHIVSFSINIYGVPRPVSFLNISNLFHPSTVAASISHNQPHEPLPGIKTDDNTWGTRPHCHRVVTITDNELSLFARLLEDSTLAHQGARLPQVHAREIIRVLRKITAAEVRLADLRGKYFATEMFHEVNAQKEGAITRNDHPSFQPSQANEWIVSGPHFYVATPFAKTPQFACLTHGSYDEIDLAGIDPDYLPRAVYRPGDHKKSLHVYARDISCWPEKANPVTSVYRYVNRRRINISIERTLVSAILPVGASHINVVMSVVFLDLKFFWRDLRVQRLVSLLISF